MTLSKGTEVQARFVHDGSLIGATIELPCLDAPIPIALESTCDSGAWYTLTIPCEAWNGPNAYTIRDSESAVISTGIINIS